MVGSQRALYVPESAPSLVQSSPKERAARSLSLLCALSCACVPCSMRSLFPPLSLRGCGGDNTMCAKCQGVNACAVSDCVLPFCRFVRADQGPTASEPPWCRVCRPVCVSLIYLLAHTRTAHRRAARPGRLAQGLRLYRLFILRQRRL
jgi:hypothetical protein